MGETRATNSGGLSSATPPGNFEWATNGHNQVAPSRARACYGRQSLHYVAEIRWEGLVYVQRVSYPLCSVNSMRRSSGAYQSSGQRKSFGSKRVVIVLRSATLRTFGNICVCVCVRVLQVTRAAILNKFIRGIMWPDEK